MGFSALYFVFIVFCTSVLTVVFGIFLTDVFTHVLDPETSVEPEAIRGHDPETSIEPEAIRGHDPETSTAANVFEPAAANVTFKSPLEPSAKGYMVVFIIGGGLKVDEVRINNSGIIGTVASASVPIEDIPDRLKNVFPEGSIYVVTGNTPTYDIQKIHNWAKTGTGYPSYNIVTTGTTTFDKMCELLPRSS